MDVVEAINQQLAVELDGEENTPKEKMKMLLMKYGLLPIQLTASEKHLIQKEERKNARR